jgi:hypothetical protein
VSSNLCGTLLSVLTVSGMPWREVLFNIHSHVSFDSRLVDAKTYSIHFEGIMHYASIFSLS